MKIVEVWAKGYADETGLSRLTIEDDADPAKAVRINGSLAKVSGVRSLNPVKVEPVSEAYARTMSQHDNS